jgi:two-component system response regulator MtrA
MDEPVLLVEDDPSIREVAKLGLSQAGFRVTTAADGREGLLHFHQTPFDLVILDVMLPTLDGYEVCRQIRAESRVPIIMLSAKSDTVDVVPDRSSPASFSSSESGTTNISATRVSSTWPSRGCAERSRKIRRSRA